MPESTRLLIVDDQEAVLAALSLLFKRKGYTCVLAATPADAVKAWRTRAFDVALIDLNFRRDTTSGEEGVTLLAQLRRVDPATPVVVMTAWGSIDVAVRTMREGASDFVEKPWDNARLFQVVDVQAQRGRDARRIARLDAENQLLRKADDAADAVFRSAAMTDLRRHIEKIARSPASVLLLGENGVGKSMIAKLIHELSPRAAQPLVKVNVGGIADSVFEAEMFGHVRGAYTDAKTDRVGRFEIAEGGTLFLDEIGNLPAPLQPKLLRVLEDGEFERVGSSRTIRADVRIVAATNADLHAEADAGRFRRDLLYRLNTVELTIPPLRARGDDIAPLAERFLALHCRRYRRGEMRIAPAALRQLRGYAWPGNVRELGHVVERAVLMAEGDVVDSFALARGGAVAADPDESSGDMHDGEEQSGNDHGRLTVAVVERDLIRSALARADGNIQEAARALGLSRAALYRRLQKFGLSG